MARRCSLWFGTEHYATWFQTPKSGADVSPDDWRASGSLINGGGWASHSWGSHRTYEYSWSDASTRQTAQLMKSFREGAYGRGLIYFIDPLTYDTNVLPAGWANPGSMSGNSAAFLNFGRESLELAGDPGPNLYPVDQLMIQASDRSVARSVYVPIPEGYRLHIAGVYEAQGITPVMHVLDHNGNKSDTPLVIPPVPADGQEVVTDMSVSGRGVYLSLDIQDRENGVLKMRAFTARLAEAGSDPDKSGPWISGQGHSGCRFDGPPTYVEYSGINGGQVGFAATFREVGMWEPIYGGVA